METAKKHSILRIALLALFATVLIFTQAYMASAATFPDVPSTDKYYSAVEDTYSKGYVKGFDDGYFRPYSVLDRVQGALIFSRILQTDLTNLTAQYFTDVPTGYRFYKEVSGIARDGIIQGYADGTYRLYDPLTRGQVALIIYRTFDFDALGNQATVPFTDVKGTQYEEAVTALYAAGVTNGVTATSFGINQSITRGDFLLLLTRAQAAIHGDKSIKDLAVKDNGNQTATITGTMVAPKTDGTELINIKIYNSGNNLVVNKDVKPNADKTFSWVTDTLALGDYQAKVSVVGSTKVSTAAFTIGDSTAPAAPGIAFPGTSVVGQVVDLLDLQNDLVTRYTFSTEGLQGVRVGDTLKYTITSDSATGPITNTHILTAQDIAQGYYEDVVTTNALQNLLGGLLDLNGILSGASVDTAAVNQDVAAAGLLDGLLGGTTGGLLGDTTDGLLGGLLDGLLGGTIDNTLNGLLDGVTGGIVDLGDGLLGIVVNGVLQGVINGSEEVTIEAQLIDAAGNESPVTTEIYQFQVTDVLGL